MNFALLLPIAVIQRQYAVSSIFRLMIDRNARDETILAIEWFLDRKIMGFEFDDRLQRIETTDRTVNWTISELWKHYDDCTDHYERLGRQEWKYLQRLKLLLASDCEISSRKVGYHWAAGVSAAMTFAVIVMVLLFCDPWTAIPSGLCLSFLGAWWIDWLVNRSKQREMSHSPELNPFHSFSDISSVRRMLLDFQARPFPDRGDDEKGLFRRGLLAILPFPHWVLYSPFVLLLQVLQPFRQRAVVLAKLETAGRLRS